MINMVTEKTFLFKLINSHSIEWSIPLILMNTPF